MAGSRAERRGSARRTSTCAIARNDRRANPQGPEAACRDRAGARPGHRACCSTSRPRARSRQRAARPRSDPRIAIEGRAVLVSTHNLGEAEELSDRIAVLKTELLAFDTPATLRRREPAAGSSSSSRAAAQSNSRSRCRSRFRRSSPTRRRRRAHRARDAGARSLEDVYSTSWEPSDDFRLRLGEGALRGIASPRSLPKTRAS